MPGEPGELGPRGCLTHLRLQHPGTGEWVSFTAEQMAAVRKVYEYCRKSFIVAYLPCPACDADRAKLCA